jgi:thiol:disulfide interchange protein DsbA
MKTLTVGLLLLLSLLPVTSWAQYEAGKNYVVLSPPVPAETGDKIEVREFFWYGCPHCYALEPYLEKWLQNVPPNVRFVRTPGVASRWLPDARAFYTFEALGVTAKVHKAFFDAIHQQGKQFDDEASVAQFLAPYGVDGETVRKVYNSFGVNTELKHAKQLNFRYAVDSVPTLTVAGRYKTDVSMAGGPDQLLVLIDYLVDQVRKARK